MNCQKCEGKFTEKDKSDTNYRESSTGGYVHRLCPGAICSICGKEISDWTQATGLGATLRHKSCKPIAINPESEKVRQVVLNEEIKEEGYDASSWIIK